MRLALVSRLSRSTMSGRIPGGAQAKPRARLVARHEITEYRNVRQDLRARGRRHRQGAQLAGANILDPRLDRAKERLDLSAEQFRQRTTAIRHVQQVDASQRLEQLAENMRRAPRPG